MALSVLTVAEAETQKLRIPGSNGNPDEFIVQGTREDLQAALTGLRIQAVYTSLGTVHRILCAPGGNQKAMEKLRQLFNGPSKVGHVSTSAEQSSPGLDKRGFHSVYQLQSGQSYTGDAEVIFLSVNVFEIVPAECYRAAHYADKTSDIVICDDLKHLNLLRDQLVARGKIAMVY